MTPETQEHLADYAVLANKVATLESNFKEIKSDIKDIKLGISDLMIKRTCSPTYLYSLVGALAGIVVTLVIVLVKSV